MSVCMPSPAALCRRNGKFRESSEDARGSKQKERREVGPLRPDLALRLLLRLLRLLLIFPLRRHKAAGGGAALDLIPSKTYEYRLIVARQ